MFVPMATAGSSLATAALCFSAVERDSTSEIQPQTRSIDRSVGRSVGTFPHQGTQAITLDMLAVAPTTTSTVVPTRTERRCGREGVVVRYRAKPSSGRLSGTARGRRAGVVALSDTSSDSGVVSSSSSSSGNTTLVVAGAASLAAIAATHAPGDAAVRAVGSTALGLALAAVGYKKKSLDASGALAAIGVGFGSIYADASFGAALAAFFFSSSAVTRIRSDVKRKVDEHFKDGGGRNWVQVLANGLVPTLVAAAFVAVASADAAATRTLASAYIGYYACCGGDTWASELGVLSKSKPRLITDPRRQVTPGTNGGVTALGWAASAGGGAVVGSAFFIGRALLESMGGASAISSASVSASPMIDFLFITAFGATCGIFGSLVDSVLGATIQYSGYCSKRERVVSKPGPTVTRISGLEFLSNSAVNLVSGIITACVAAAVSPL